MLPEKHNWEVPGGVTIAENYFYLVIIMMKITYPKIMPDKKKSGKEKNLNFFHQKKSISNFFEVFKTKNWCRNSFFGGIPVEVTHGGGQSVLLINTSIQLQSKKLKMPMNISAVCQGPSNADSLGFCAEPRGKATWTNFCPPTPPDSSLVTPSGISGHEFPSGYGWMTQMDFALMWWSEMNSPLPRHCCEQKWICLSHCALPWLR